MPTLQLPDALSDWALVADFVLAVVLLGVFALGRPRTWQRDPLGWVIFYYAAATVSLLFLIVWGIVFGQKVEEGWRLIIAVGLGFALTWKTTAIVRERRAGRLARRNREKEGTSA